MFLSVVDMISAEESFASAFSDVPVIGSDSQASTRHYVKIKLQILAGRNQQVKRYIELGPSLL